MLLGGHLVFLIRVNESRPIELLTPEIIRFRRRLLQLTRHQLIQLRQFVIVLCQAPLQRPSKVDKSGPNFGHSHLFVDVAPSLSLFSLLSHVLVQSLDNIGVVLTDRFLEIGCSFDNIKLLLLTRGSVVFEIVVLLLHVAEFLLVSEICKSFQSVKLFDELKIIFFIVLRMQLKIYPLLPLV